MATLRFQSTLTIFLLLSLAVTSSSAFTHDALSRLLTVAPTRWQAKALHHLENAGDWRRAGARSSESNRSSLDELRKVWVDRSITYYSKVMREERRRELGQIRDNDYNPEDFIIMAKKHYYALRKIKDGKPMLAERIYRRIIDQLLIEEKEGSCDHTKLAVTTLLLALLLQREGHPAPKTRAVFLHFFRKVQNSNDECACSAKVLQAFALFEMKHGNSIKSLHIITKAIQMDPSLRPVLKWKQFQNAQKQLETIKSRRGTR